MGEAAQVLGKELARGIKTKPAQGLAVDVGRGPGPTRRSPGWSRGSLSGAPRLVGRESPRGLFPLGVPPSAREPHLRTRISPLREAPRTCSEALWVPLEGHWTGDRLPCLAGLVFFF